MDILIKGEEMPSVCDCCWALDESGDYPMCRITEETRGYNFRVREKRMDKCPLIELPDHVKHGKWIKMSDADGVYWACSECGEDIPRVSHFDPRFDLFPRLESIDMTNYCPNCGAPMERSEDA